MRMSINLLLSFALCLPLSGCISLGEAPEVRVFSPEVRIAPAGDWPRTSMALVVMKPLSGDALDTRRIVVRPTPDTMNVYAQSSWAEPMPAMLQNLLVRAFEDSGKLASVARQTDGLRSDTALLLDVRHFESVYADGAKIPEVVIEIHAKLLAHPSAKPITARTFRVQVKSEGKEVRAVVDAFETAMGDIGAQIVGWTLSSGNPAK